MKHKIVIFLCVIISNITFSQTKTDFFDQVNEFFKDNVTLDGKVKYAAFKKSPGELMYILNNIEKLKLDKEEKDTKIAFWINAYNLLVIRNVIENYPLKSVKFVTGFFEKKFQIADNEYSLNEIEELLSILMKDPGLHFVLANGTNGGNRLLNSAYLPETVMYQVSYQLKTSINKSGFIKVDKDTKSVELPLIFETHKSDFVTQYYNQIDFLNVFLDKKIDNKSAINFTKFDWSLNEIN